MNDPLSSNPLCARLRERATVTGIRLHDEAADEIERLTAELVGVKATLKEEFRENAKRAASIDRLRAALENIANGRVGDQVMTHPDLYARAQLGRPADETSPTIQKFVGDADETTDG